MTTEPVPPFDGLQGASAAEATVARVERLADRWADMIATESEIMTTAQRNAWGDALAELRLALPDRHCVEPVDHRTEGDRAVAVLADTPENVAAIMRAAFNPSAVGAAGMARSILAAQREAAGIE